MKNETGRLVQFSHVRTSCSCGGKTQLEKKVLAPGEQTVLHFNIDLRNRRGPQRFVCWLVEVGGNEWSFSLQTTVYEREQFEPREAIHFGTDSAGVVKAENLTFILHRRSGEKVPQVSFQPRDKNLTIQPGEPQTEQLVDGVVRCAIPIRVELRFPSQIGLSQSSIQAVLETTETRPCAVTWSVRSPYRVTPTQVFFGRVDRSSVMLERTVEIRREDGQQLAIKRVKCSSPQVECVEEESPDRSAVRFRFTFRTDNVRLLLCRKPRNLLCGIGI